jgi:glycosyltransferase involved in cell wall biosynthesis
MHKYIEELLPGLAGKIEYIPHWHDDKLIYPVKLEDNSFFKNLNVPGLFVVQYAGNMGLWNDMQAIGRAVIQNPKGVFFVFVGDGMRKKELQDIISTNVSTNAMFLPFQPAENLCEVLTGCHAAIVSLRAGMEGMAVPSKIYGILAAGIPVIAMVPEESEIAYLVNEEKCGIVVQPDDHEGLNKSIEKLKSDNNLRKNYGKNGRAAFENKYTTKIIADKYLMLIDEVENE